MFDVGGKLLVTRQYPRLGPFLAVQHKGDVLTSQPRRPSNKRPVRVPFLRFSHTLLLTEVVPAN